MVSNNALFYQSVFSGDTVLAFYNCPGQAGRSGWWPGTVRAISRNDMLLIEVSSIAMIIARSSFCHCYLCGFAMFQFESDIDLGGKFRLDQTRERQLVPKQLVSYTLVYRF